MINKLPDLDFYPVVSTFWRKQIIYQSISSELEINSHLPPWRVPRRLPWLGGFPQGKVILGLFLTQSVGWDAQVTCIRWGKVENNFPAQLTLLTVLNLCHSTMYLLPPVKLSDLRRPQAPVWHTSAVDWHQTWKCQSTQNRLIHTCKHRKTK